MKFYRYEIGKGEHAPMVRLIEYGLVRETPRGYWICESSGLHYPDWIEAWKRWVPKVSKKRFAYPTKAEALVNFIKRTEMRVGYLERDLRFCKSALRKAKSMFEEEILV